jgi:ribosome-associated heat shock protein Hsp15
MRIDQYLWAVRYFKSRSIATKACKKGQVRVNDQVVKPSREVFPMDKIILRKEQVNLTLDVLDIPKSRVGAKLVDLYRVNTTPKDAFKQNELQNLAQDYYRQKGEGRPTKKDRRDLDEYADKPDQTGISLHLNLLYNA